MLSGAYLTTNALVLSVSLAVAGLTGQPAAPAALASARRVCGDLVVRKRMGMKL